MKTSHIRVSRSAAYYRKHRSNFYRERVYRGLRHLGNLPLELREFVSDMTVSGAVPFNLPSSNMHVRSAAARALVRATTCYAKRHLEERLYLVTYALACGITPFDEPVLRPAAQLEKVYQSLRRAGLEGLIVNDQDILAPDNRPGGSEQRRILDHHHVLVFSNLDEAGVKKSLALERARPSFVNTLGGANIHVRLVRDTQADIARVASYLYKPVVCYKRRVPQVDRPSRTKLETQKARLSSRAVIRLSELRSHTDIINTCRGVGGVGRVMRRSWKRHLLRWRDEHASGVVYSAAEVEVHWREVRDLVGPATYLPCVVNAPAR